MITLTPLLLLQDGKMGETIDEREARTEKVLIEYPTTQNTIYLMCLDHVFLPLLHWV